MYKISARCFGLLLLFGVIGSTPARAAFTDINAGLTGVIGSVAWGDYDNDGDLDLAVAGSTAGGRIVRIYKNTNGVFADAMALPASLGVALCSLAWGDYDNDGDLDLAVAGDTASPA